MLYFSEEYSQINDQLILGIHPIACIALFSGMQFCDGWVHSVNIDTTVERVIELRLDLGNYCSVRSLENFLPAAARTWRSRLCELREKAMSAHQMQRMK